MASHVKSLRSRFESNQKPNPPPAEPVRAGHAGPHRPISNGPKQPAAGNFQQRPCSGPGKQPAPAQQRPCSGPGKQPAPAQQRPFSGPGKQPAPAQQRPNLSPNPPFDYARHEKTFERKVTKSIEKGLLSPFPGVNPKQNHEQWRQLLSDPRNCSFEALLDMWFRETEPQQGKENERMFRVYFTLNSSAGRVQKFIAARLAGTPYNALHAALRVYNQVVDWRDNSLTFPREANLVEPLMMLGIGCIRVVKVGNRYEAPAIDAICEVMKEWNYSKKYDTRVCNCAHFVNELIARIQQRDPNVRFPASSDADRATELFLGRVRSGHLTKTITQEMVRFKLEDINDRQVKEIEFTSHEMLDAWCERLKKQTNEFAGYSSLKELLKSFDRAFHKDLSRFSLERYKLEENLEKITDPKMQAKIKERLAFLDNEIKNATPGTICAFPFENVSPIPTLPSSKTKGSTGNSKTNPSANSSNSLPVPGSSNSNVRT